ncbi:hypothetical protein [Pseudonocardia spinosispora]|uniref:hypothetical protein n=1 Tax=Pseudonocardia spinosispora TaxID=103441 RepID=UPI0012EBDFB8|nr:hypothetical protein [Pseudonocardia spinosispora]
MADEQRVRFATLVLLVQRLEYEDLLTVRGDVAIVAPLDGDKLSAAQRFGMRIERALIPRSFELLTPAHLAEIGSLLPPPDAGRLDFADDFVLNGAGVIETLYAGASRFDRREIQMLIDHGKRYNVFAGLQTDSLGTGAAHAYCDVQREIVNLLRAGLIAPAVDLQLTLFERLHAFGQQSLDYPQLSDDDQPMATVLPIGASARRRRATHEGT